MFNMGITKNRPTIKSVERPFFHTPVFLSFLIAHTHIKKQMTHTTTTVVDEQVKSVFFILKMIKFIFGYIVTYISNIVKDTRKCPYLTNVF